MKDKGSKIHKLDSTRSRAGGVEEASVPDAPEPIRHIAYPVYEATQFAAKDEIDLLVLWAVLCRYRFVIIGSLLLALVLATAVAFLSQPVFRAELVMIPTLEEKSSGLSSLAGQLGGLASLAGVTLSSGDGDTDKTLAVLRSRAFLLPFLKQEKIIDELDRVRSGFIDTEPWSKLDAYRYFSADVLDVQKDRKTGLVVLAMEWHDPRQAAQWANRLVARLNEHQRHAAVSEARRSIDYLEKQLKETRIVDMQQAIYRLIESQTKVIMLANVKQEYAMQVIDPALAPDESERPKRLLILMLGGLLGLMVGIFLAFVLNLIQGARQHAG
jgi:uncharacterized protein involved in exopolysaccharide biosynthesis